MKTSTFKSSTSKSKKELLIESLPEALHRTNHSSTRTAHSHEVPCQSTSLTNLNSMTEDRSRCSKIIPLVVMKSSGLYQVPMSLRVAALEKCFESVEEYFNQIEHNSLLKGLVRTPEEATEASTDDSIALQKTSSSTSICSIYVPTHTRNDDLLTVIYNDLYEREKHICLISKQKNSYKLTMANLARELKKKMLPEYKKLQELSILMPRDVGPDVQEKVILEEPSWEQVQAYLLTDAQLAEQDFPLIPWTREILPLPLDKETDLPMIVVSCTRCSVSFNPSVYYSKDSHQEHSLNDCRCHDGKFLWPYQSPKHARVQSWTCCGSHEQSSFGCSTFPKHVFALRHSGYFWDQFKPSLGDLLEGNLEKKALQFYALDCEMIHTERGLELARLTVIHWMEGLVLDLLVRPLGRVVDYNTKFSGITADMYHDPSTSPKMHMFKNFLDGKYLDHTSSFSFDQVQNLFLSLFKPHQTTILIGHSLENDLRVLKVAHRYIIDSAILYPHPKGHTWRYSLKHLSSTHLKEFIQQHQPTLQVDGKDQPIGHSSFEDAAASLRLFKLKLAKDLGIIS